MQREEHHHAVLELGMNQPGEIDYLSRIARPSVAVITNAGSAHLEGLRDVTGVARAKAEILNGLDRSGAVVINADDRFAAYWLARARHFRSVRFGLDSEADIRGDATTVGDKLLIEVSLPDDRLEFQLSLLGRHNARNALAAVAAACLLAAALNRSVMAWKKYDLFGVDLNKNKHRLAHS